MDTHIQGRTLETNSLGAIPALRGFELDYKTTTAVVCTIDASETDPVLLEIWPTVTTAFNAGTTNVISVINQKGVTLLTFSDPTTIGIQSYNNFLVQTQTLLNISYTHTGTSPTQGQGLLMVRVSGLGKGVNLNLGKL